MNSQLRVKSALEHAEPELIPIDLGSNVTSIHKNAYTALRAYLGLPLRQTEIIDRMQQVVKIDQDILERYEVDTRHVFLKPAMPWQDYGNGKYKDEWGIIWHPSNEGKYFDIYSNPLKNMSYADFKKYKFPDPDDTVRFQGLEDSCQKYCSEGKAVVLNGFGECVLGRSSFLRGHVELYMDLFDKNDFVKDLLSRCIEYTNRLIANALDAVGKYISVVRIADDLGTENSTLISPECYREMIKPGHKSIVSTIKANSEAKVLLHSCGAISNLIEDFIEIGIDAINPVQTSAEGMGAKDLKREYGSRITFWGGGIDTQKTLPFGSKEDIINEINERINIFSPDGGFVFTPIHNLQPDVHPEKIDLLYKAFLARRSYAGG